MREAPQQAFPARRIGEGPLHDPMLERRQQPLKEDAG
jgi:hypothetical protein